MITEEVIDTIQTKKNHNNNNTELNCTIPWQEKFANCTMVLDTKLVACITFFLFLF